jgi:hypothetical protein
MDTVQEKQALKERTWERNAAIWEGADLSGFTHDLANLEAVLNDLGEAVLQQHLTIIDADAVLEADWRNRLYTVELAGLESDRRLALEKYETDRQVLALRMVGQAYLLAAREYDIRVQDQIMAAKEYAAAQEAVRLELEKARAEMAVRREEAKLKEIEARLILERYEQAKVDVEIARTRLSVAKAQVQAVLADIGVEEAKLRVIQANLEVAMAEADKAGLQADVASILADIIVRQLTEIRLQVETAEIEAGFRYIQQHLEDMLQVWASRVLVEALRKEAEEAMLPEVERQIAAQRQMAETDLTAMQARADLWNFEKFILEAMKDDEAAWRTSVHESKLDLARLKSQGSRELDEKGLWAKVLLNIARRWTYRNALHDSTQQTTIGQQISKGNYVVLV